MICNAKNGPQMVLDITNKEKDVARNSKQEFRDVLKKLAKCVSIIVEFKNAIVSQNPQDEELNIKYHARILRYRRKIKESVNDFLQYTKDCLNKLVNISDPGMIRLREIIVAEVGEFSDGAQSLMDVLYSVDRADRSIFIKSVEQLTSQMEKRQRSIIDVIDNQLFGHIDHDILGKMKISKIRFDIIKRSRLIKMLVK